MITSRLIYRYANHFEQLDRMSENPEVRYLFANFIPSFTIIVFQFIHFFKSCPSSPIVKRSVEDEVGYHRNELEYFTTGSPLHIVSTGNTKHCFSIGMYTALQKYRN